MPISRRSSLPIASTAKQRAIANLLTAITRGSQADLEQAALEFDAVILWEARAALERHAA